MAIGYTLGPTFLAGNQKGSSSNPFYNPSEVLKVQQIIKKDPTAELVLDNEFGYISQVLDHGLSPYYTRNKILTTKGYGIVEDVVETDDQVIASLEKLKLSVLQLKITPVKPKKLLPKYNEVADYLVDYWTYQLDEMQGTIEDALYELDSDRIIYGHAFSEKNWKWCEEGEYKGKLILDNIKGKKPGVFQFDLDSFANILSITDLAHFQPLPKEKFIYSTWKKKRSNPYGSGLAQTLYPLCYAKQQLLKIMLVGAGKWANPSVVIYLPSGGEAELQQAEQFANQLQSSSCGSLPEGYKAELLEIANRSQNPCIEIIQYLNTAIARTIESTAATTNENTNGYGSKADTKEKGKSSKVHELYLIKSDGDLLKEQLVRPNTRLNFDIDKVPLCAYPDLKFAPIDEENKSSKVDRLKTIWDMGFLDENNPDHRTYVQAIDEIPDDSETFKETEEEEQSEPKENIPGNKEVVNQSNSENEPEIFNYEFD